MTKQYDDDSECDPLDADQVDSAQDRRQQSPTNSRKTLWIILSVVGVLSLAILVVCGGAAYFFVGLFQTGFNTERTMQRVLDHFAEPEILYAEFTPEYQARMPLEQLSAMLEKFPIFSHFYYHNELRDPKIENFFGKKKVTVFYRFTPASTVNSTVSPVNVTIELVEQEGDMKISNIIIE